ncbi:MAG: thiamine pyrophosphate-binding protein [Sulfolobales archaeon]
MKAARALLEMLKEYEVDYVFGLPGETTLPLYNEWFEFPYVKHVMLRDERNACFAADGYGRVSFKPGICESPSVGATHVIPAAIEAFKSSMPMIFITTDTPLYLEKKNALTSFDQTALFSGIVKESITVFRGQDIPYAVRRAFRVATTGKPGPVHIRIPMNALEEEIGPADVYAQKNFSRYPGHRFTANRDSILKAADLLLRAERPLIICGQGALYSSAWDELIELAELMEIPVGTTITGKGCFPETHSLSIGVIGSRGGTGFSNSILRSADLVFYVGCNTDQAATDSWTLPSPETKVVHLDISEAEVGNSLRTDVMLVGDAKATLEELINVLKSKAVRRRLEWVNYISARREAYEAKLSAYAIAAQDEYPINPLVFLKKLEELLPADHLIICDPGVSAIYTSAYFKVRKPGRRLIFNYSMGALGYAIPASIGAALANPNAITLALTGDGSFGFVAGELETLARLRLSIKVILYDNQSFGWIRASIMMRYGPKYFATEFKSIDYVKIAEGFGLQAFRIEEPKDLELKLKELVKAEGPALLDLPVLPEDKLVPPVPAWASKAEQLGIPFVY